MVIHNYANFFILKSCKKLLSKFGKYSNELAYLMNYLKSGIDPHDFPHYLGEFYNYIGKKMPEGKEEFDILYEMTKQEKDDYKKWLEDIISKGKMTPDALDPSYLYMEYKSIINPNTWLIHFTNNAYDISRRGFIRGTEDMNTLGLTTQLTKKDKGWNFAFEPLSKHAGYAAQNEKYGKNAVLFRGVAGVKVYHYRDEEEQIIFVGENARDIVPLFRSEQGWTVESAEDGKKLVEGNYEKVVLWVMNNYEQYKRILKISSKSWVINNCKFSKIIESSLKINKDQSVTIDSADDIPMTAWNKIYLELKKMGYDIRSGEDAKEIFYNTKTFTGDHAEAIINAMGLKRKNKINIDKKPLPQKIFDEEANASGITDLFEHAGYIIPDGRMLDFSYTPGMRDKDHRELSINPGTKGMLAFISGGAIRISKNGLHIGRPPTEQQYKTIIEFIKHNRGNIFNIELQRGMSWNKKKGWVDSKYNKSYEYDRGTNPSTIINDIREFYK